MGYFFISLWARYFLNQWIWKELNIHCIFSLLLYVELYVNSKYLRVFQYNHISKFFEKESKYVIVKNVIMFVKSDILIKGIYFKSFSKSIWKLYHSFFFSSLDLRVIQIMQFQIFKKFWWFKYELLCITK